MKRLGHRIVRKRESPVSVVFSTLIAEENHRCEPDVLFQTKREAPS